MLSVLNVAFPFVPVCADSIGGAEQIVAALDRSLVAAGHRSTVIAHAASRIEGRLVPVHPRPGRIDDQTRADARRECREAVARVLAAGDVDVVHLHGIGFLDQLPDADAPAMVTLHLPLPWYPREAITDDGRMRRICVSRTQRARARELGLTERDEAQMLVIENGVPLDRFRPEGPKKDFALALGRLCPEKGFDLAIAAARRAGRSLVVAGATVPFEEHERYFRDVLAPSFDRRCRFVGPVTGEIKRRLLARARCVLIPSRVDETSSLVAMEALASGTPVIALRRGALPEIVEHGRTGFLVDGEQEMGDAIAAADELRPEDCRAAAEARFSAGEMVRRYHELYEHAAASKGASRATPRFDVETIEDDARLEALASEWSALCDASPHATPFQRPEWLLAARRHLSGGARAWVLAVRRGPRLVGLLPLEREAGALRWIGAGVSDYLDLIAEPAFEREVLDALLAHLATAEAPWSTLELDGLRSDSPLVSCPLPAVLSGTLAEAPPSPVVALPAAPPERLPYYRRRLARAGSVRWQQATAATALQMVRALIVLHAARWASRGQPGVLADSAVQRFHLEAAPALAGRGLLRMYALELDGRTLGVLYAFADHGRVHFYLSGFDPEAARLNAGTLLIDHAVEEAHARGDAEFDFLRGREAYKYEWGARNRPAFSRRIRHG